MHSREMWPAFRGKKSGVLYEPFWSRLDRFDKTASHLTAVVASLAGCTSVEATGSSSSLRALPGKVADLTASVAGAVGLTAVAVASCVGVLRALAGDVALLVAHSARLGLGCHTASRRDVTCL